MGPPELWRWLARIALVLGVGLLLCGVAITVIGATQGTSVLGDSLLPAVLVVLLALPPLIWGWMARRGGPGAVG